MNICLRLLLALTILGAPGAWAAQAPGTDDIATLSPARQLDRLDRALADAHKSLQRDDAEGALPELRQQALSVLDQANQLSTQLAPQRAAVEAQLAVLGPAPAAEAVPETAEVAAQRRKLERAQADIDAQIKQAQLLGQGAMQLAADIASRRSDAFQARLAVRLASPLTRAFWSGLASNTPDDLGHIAPFAHRLGADLTRATQPGQRLPLLLCLLLAGACAFGGRALLERLVLLPLVRRLPEGRLRRSALATAIALGTALVAGIAAELALIGLDWRGALGEESRALALALVGLITFAAYVNGLGRALLSARRPSWRLSAIGELTAARLRPFPPLLALAALLLGCAERLARSIGASLAVSVTLRGAFALVISGLIGAALWRLHRTRLEAARLGTMLDAARPLWLAALLGAAAVGVVLSWLGVAAGYLAFAFFVAVQMLWTGVIIASAWLLARLGSDLAEALVSSRGAGGQRLAASFGISPHLLDQLAVVVAGGVRVALAIGVLGAVLTPFGAGPGELAGSMRTLTGNLQLGELAIHPRSILTAALVLAIGMLLLRTFMHWLRGKLLPASTMEAGMQESIATLLGYLGGLLVLVLTLAALHVDLKSIAWIVSALSVGIGFGLQAIVQNFISGLILLVERPVKVGDWVSLSDDVEGDIQRINVRATEIRLWDRSTMIVPNSQLIAQNVRNVTRTGALGRVLIQLPMPLDIDAGRVRELLLPILAAHPATLETPAPAVLLDSVLGGTTNFLLVAYVSGPRAASGVKSELLFQVLDALRTAGITLSGSQTVVMQHAAPAAGAAPAGLTPP